MLLALLAYTGSMRQDLSDGTGSVCPIHRPMYQRAASLLLWARRAGHIDRQRRAPQQQG